MKSLRFVSSFVPSFISSFAVLLIGLGVSQPVAYASSGPLIFLPAVDYYSGGENGISVAMADVNGDGKLDMIVASFCASTSNCTGLFGPGGVNVLLGNGDGTFQPPVTYSSGGYNADAVAIADVNGDGKLDVVVANQCQSSTSCIGSVSVLLGNGNGTFQPPVSYSTAGYTPESVAVADLNGDGHPDIVVANLCGTIGNCGSDTIEGQISVFIGNGDGTFQPAALYSSEGYSAMSVAIGDINGDGKLDVLAANSCGAYKCSPTTGNVGVLLDTSGGILQGNTAPGSGGSFADSIAVADVDGDGHLDLVVTNQCLAACPGSADVSVLLGNGDGSFQAAVPYNLTLGQLTSVAAADVNGDGHPDLLVAGGGVNGAVGVLLGNGDGTFQLPNYYYGTGGNQAPGQIVMHDVNGDGRPDLIVINGGVGSNNVAVLLNNNGAPASTTTLVPSVNPVDVRKPVTYTATVASSSGTLKGTVAFTDGGTTVATVTLTNNQAVYSPSYTRNQVGAHTITATYGGELDVATGSQSASLTEYVRNATSKTAAATSGSPSTVGQPVTFTATVTSHNATIPNGEIVTFSSGKTTLGTGTITGGVASLTTSFSKAKTYTVKAAYPGDNTFEPSSGTVKQIVEK
jgi:hypothetical protein